VKAFGINRMDISQREGKYPPPLGSSDILGVEFSGVVEAVGESVDEWCNGEQVLGLVGGVSISPSTAILAERWVVERVRTLSMSSR